MNQPSLLDLPDPSTRLHHRRDPDTSRQAAQSILGALTEIQQRVLDYARDHPEGFTDADLGAAFPGASYSTYRTRRGELVEKGLIVDTGQRVKLPSGRGAVVWRAR